jgi:hypothetical protein
VTAVTELNPGASAFVNTSSGFVATLSDNHWPPAAPEGPYGGTPAAVPGTVQAENPCRRGSRRPCRPTVRSRCCR